MRVWEHGGTRHMSDTSKKSFLYLDQLSLRAKVTLVLLTISLGPLLITGMVNVNRAMERGQKSEAAHFAQSAMFTAAAFADLFEHVRIDLNAIAQRFPAENFDFDAIRAEMDSGKGLRPSLDEWRMLLFNRSPGSSRRSFSPSMTGDCSTYPFRNVSTSAAHGLTGSRHLQSRGDCGRRISRPGRNAAPGRHGLRSPVFPIEKACGVFGSDHRQRETSRDYPPDVQRSLDPWRHGVTLSDRTKWSDDRPQR